MTFPAAYDFGRMRRGDAMPVGRIVPLERNDPRNGRQRSVVSPRRTISDEWDEPMRSPVAGSFRLKETI
jgi:hypothetical protein